MKIKQIIQEILRSKSVKGLFSSEKAYADEVTNNLIDADLNAYCNKLKRSSGVVAGVFNEESFMKGLTQMLILNRVRIDDMISRGVDKFSIDTNALKDFDNSLVDKFETIGYAGMYRNGEYKIRDLKFLKAMCEYDGVIDSIRMSKVRPDLNLLGGWLYDDSVIEKRDMTVPVFDIFEDEDEFVRNDDIELE